MKEEIWFGLVYKVASVCVCLFVKLAVSLFLFGPGSPFFHLSVEDKLLLIPTSPSLTLFFLSSLAKRRKDEAACLLPHLPGIIKKRTSLFRCRRLPVMFHCVLLLLLLRLLPLLIHVPLLSSLLLYFVACSLSC